MLTHNDLKKGVQFIMDKQPCEVLESSPIKKAQSRAIIQTRIKNLITGAIYDNNFHQGDSFQEAKIERKEIKFLYSHRDKFFFCEKENPSKRFELTAEIIRDNAKFLKQNEIIEGVYFNDSIINISLPIKVQLKVTQSPPGLMGDSAQGATKSVELETGAEINVPLFIEENDIIEVNTETGQYVKRTEKGAQN